MKRIALLFIAAMLAATPAFASGKSQQATQMTDPGKARQTNVMNETTVQGSQLMNIGKRNTMDVGVVSNSGNGDQTNVINETRVKNSTLMNSGEDNAMGVGTVRQGN